MIKTLKNMEKSKKKSSKWPKQIKKKKNGGKIKKVKKK